MEPDSFPTIDDLEAMNFRKSDSERRMVREKMIFHLPTRTWRLDGTVVHPESRTEVIDMLRGHRRHHQPHKK